MLDILHTSIAKVCPIEGLSFNKDKIRIDFAPEATTDQRTAARTLRDEWLVKTDAEKELVREQQGAIDNPEKSDFKSQVASDIETIDNYFAIAAPTNAQHFAQLRELSRITRRLLRIVKRELT